MLPSDAPGLYPPPGTSPNFLVQHRVRSRCATPGSDIHRNRGSAIGIGVNYTVLGRTETAHAGLVIAERRRAGLVQNVGQLQRRQLCPWR